MSAPDTNIKKQERRHKPALWGIKAAVIGAILALLAVIAYFSLDGTEPTTGAVSPSDAEVGVTETGVAAGADTSGE